MTKPATILLLTPSFPPAVSGAATYFSELAQRLAKHRHITVLTTTQANRAASEPSLRILAALPMFLRWPALARVVIIPPLVCWRLFRLSRQYRVKVLHAHSSNAMVLGALVWSVLSRTPLTYDVQDLMTPTWVLRLGYRRRYVATGPTVARRLQKLGIPSESVMTVWSNPPAAITELGELQRQGSDIIFVGELNIHVKGLDTLFTAFRRVHQFMPNARLVIVGDGPDRSRCHEMAQAAGLADRILFRGSLPLQQTLRAIGEAALLVLPSRTEGIPRVIQEAFALGTPVVASRVGGIPDVVAQDVNGLLVPVGNSDALSEAMVRLLRDEGERLRLGSNAKSKSERGPTWDEAIRKLLHWYNHE